VKGDEGVETSPRYVTSEAQYPMSRPHRLWGRTVVGHERRALSGAPVTYVEEGDDYISCKIVGSSDLYRTKRHFRLSHYNRRAERWVKGGS
jgi:hypothetical protein